MVSDMDRDRYGSRDLHGSIDMERAPREERGAISIEIAAASVSPICELTGFAIDRCGCCQGAEAVAELARQEREERCRFDPCGLQCPRLARYACKVPGIPCCERCSGDWQECVTVEPL